MSVRTRSEESKMGEAKRQTAWRMSQSEQDSLEEEEEGLQLLVSVQRTTSTSTSIHRCVRCSSFFASPSVEIRGVDENREVGEPPLWRRLVG